jgi:hypothetical protein
MFYEKLHEAEIELQISYKISTPLLMTTLNTVYVTASERRNVSV